MLTGKVIRAKGKVFTVLSDGIEYPCEILKKIKRSEGSTLVAVGDLVDFRSEKDGPGGIEVVHPRRTRFSRPRIGIESEEQIIAANVDQMVIVVSVAKPRFKQHLIDRFIVAGLKGQLRILLVINKIDLEHDIDLEYLGRMYQSIDVPMIKSSTISSSGIEELRQHLKDHESIVVGHSGVGKSSLLNTLQPGLGLKVKEISSATSKGVHATTSVELHPLLFGGYVVDTPGLKIFGIWDLKKDELQDYFPEFREILGACKFHSCSHTHEPECAIKQAVTEKRIFPERYASYQRLYESSP